MATKRQEQVDGCFARAADDEPLFVLRAQDRLAPTVVRLWAELAAMFGCPGTKVDGARAIADQMVMWPTRKYPGKTHGGKPERQQDVEPRPAVVTRAVDWTRAGHAIQSALKLSGHDVDTIMRICGAYIMPTSDHIGPASVPVVPGPVPGTFVIPTDAERAATTQRFLRGGIVPGRWLHVCHVGGCVLEMDGGKTVHGLPCGTIEDICRAHNTVRLVAPL